MEQSLGVVHKDTIGAFSLLAQVRTVTSDMEGELSCVRA